MAVSLVNKVLLTCTKTQTTLKKKKQLSFQAPSAATKRPTACDPPPPVSTNSTSDTMTLSSRTEPQPMQTASPRAWSTSMSVQPQFLHTPGLMAPPQSLMGNNGVSSSCGLVTLFKCQKPASVAITTTFSFL